MINFCLSNLKFYIKKTFKRLQRRLVNNKKNIYLAPIIYGGNNIFFECNKNSYIEKKVLFHHNHCNYILDSISEFILDDSYFIDIGANIGTVSLSIAKKFRKNGLKVLAFEASERISIKFKRNLNINNLTNVRLLNQALSRNNSIVDFYEPDDSSFNQGLGSLSKNLDLKKYFKKKIQTRSLDSLLKDEELTDIKISVIKIDVQGHEIDILAGAKETIRRCTPVIVMEYEEQYDDINKCNKLNLLKFIEEFGYEVFLVDIYEKDIYKKINLANLRKGNILCIKN
tara:strand:+ start:1536 stop:2387 length:852 start_codon:yes stop_codon:yes gene_type:complete